MRVRRAGRDREFIEPCAIRDEATDWGGCLLSLLRDVSGRLVVGMLGRDSSAPAREAARHALAILEDAVRSQTNVVTEDQSDVLVAKIEAGLVAHDGV